VTDQITVYEKPTCTKCREMDRFLRESAVDFAKINYYLEPLSEKKLRELVKKMGIKPRELLRTSEQVYRDLCLGKRDFSDDQIILLMVKASRSHAAPNRRAWRSSVARTSGGKREGVVVISPGYLCPLW